RGNEPDSPAWEAAVERANAARDALLMEICRTYGEAGLDAFAEAAEAFFGDVTYMEPRLVAMYDEVLPRLDRALGAPATTAAAR
ncbi:MAG TPA: hypothetical protein VJT85_02270, partial [Gemmatimonadaceae bacterium]|nr:hypothetical protein [Gemmatimonadaceae bacterium]